MPRTDMSHSPLRLIVMGVSGCGKSTMAAALGERLGLDMVDGDDLHLPESVAKMRSGIALQDADRWPWLDRIGEYLSQPHAQGRVVACSALKRAYRDRIREQAGNVWEADRKLFQYDPKGRLRISLVYDTRQEFTQRVVAVRASAAACATRWTPANGAPG